MKKPLVAIVGRPNVGKSTLFNQIIKQRKSIVEETPGVTRDRIYADARWLDKEFTLIDTGGIEFGDSQDLNEKVRVQVEIAMEDAELILFVLDAQTNITYSDLQIASILRKSNKPVIPVVNKVDNFSMKDQTYEFLQLGFSGIIPISAANSMNIGDLLDAIINNIKFSEEKPEEDSSISVAVIGKPNVGKSSFINAVLDEERLIVDSTPGTTRDAIDSHMCYNENRFTLIDTAGIRRKARIKDSVEHYSVLRSFKGIERANVVLFMLDASENLSEQDKTIVGFAHEEKKAIIVLVNKWDLVEKETNTARDFELDIRREIKFLHYAPVMFISALTGQRIFKVLDAIVHVYSEYSRKIPTSKVNQVIQKALVKHQLPHVKGRQLKIYYGTQTGVRPPVFSIFVNHPNDVHFSYTRFLENQIRAQFGFTGSPIVINYLRNK